MSSAARGIEGHPEPRCEGPPGRVNTARAAPGENASQQLQELAGREADICTTAPYDWPESWPDAVERAYHLGRALAFTDAIRVVDSERRGAHPDPIASTERP